MRPAALALHSYKRKILGQLKYHRSVSFESGFQVLTYFDNSNTQMVDLFLRHELHQCSSFLLSRRDNNYPMGGDLWGKWKMMFPAANVSVTSEKKGLQVKLESES